MRVYIGDTYSILPEVYDVHYLVDRIYPVEKVGEKTNRLLHKLAKSVGIKKKPLVLDIDSVPQIKLKKEEYHPVNWGKEIINRFIQQIGKENIGFLSVSYNIAFNRDYLPNIASRLVMESGLKLDVFPEEIPYYGCASGIFSLKNAVEYCRKHNKAAVVFTFDQCSQVSYFTYDQNDPFFKKTLKSYFLFSDGAVGLLVLPESLMEKFGKKGVEIEDIVLTHHPGDTIKMEKGKFLLSKNLKDEVSPIVADKALKPLLNKHQLTVKDIEEWALHQGGFTVLEKFKDPQILGLSDKQLSRAEELLRTYGNLSSPSCLLVLDSFFHEKNGSKKGKKGVIAGFGAGYYIGAALYRWI
ncbi:3-oxoacyl-[acyl-carrier-protein] synthase III C-terminal domain-containing protein [Persephonella sp.]